MKITLRILKTIPFFAILVLLTGFSYLATTIHVDWISGAVLALLLLVMTSVIAYTWWRSRHLGWMVLFASTMLSGGAYQFLEPKQDRDWAFDVAKPVLVRAQGDSVSLTNIRDFDWKTPTSANVRWIERSYDLNELASVEIFTSVWDNPNIAHLLVSFGFSNAPNLVYSVEIRREEDETFNSLGGFFRQFELVLIAATENDIVRLRTNIRNETVSRYQINLTQNQMKNMFLAYVQLARDLEKEPQFYNTITANCTTVVYKLAKALSTDLPLDYRLLLSGGLPGYLDELGILGGAGSLAEKAESSIITPRAQTIPSGVIYSQFIRSQH